MTAKQWLNRARRIEQEIKNKEKTKEAIVAELTKITQSYSRNEAQTTKDPHKFDRVAIIEDQIDQKIEQLGTVLQEIIDTIDMVEDSRYRQILFGRYIAGWTWEQIAVSIRYSYKQTLRLHGHALLAVEKFIKK